MQMGEGGRGEVGGLTVSDDFLRVGAILLSLGRAGSLYVTAKFTFLGEVTFISHPYLITYRVHSP